MPSPPKTPVSCTACTACLKLQSSNFKILCVHSQDCKFKIQKNTFKLTALPTSEQRPLLHGAADTSKGIVT